MKYVDFNRAASTMGSPESAWRVLQIAAESLQRECTQFRQALQEADTTACFKILHAMKGSIQIYGSDYMVDQVFHTEKRKSESVTPQLLADLTLFSLDLQGLADEVQANCTTRAPATR